MASTSTQSGGFSIVTTDYMRLLHSLCVYRETTFQKIVSSFRKLHKYLDVTRPEDCAERSASFPSSLSASERDCRSAACGSVPSASGSGNVCEGPDSDVGFERSCTWEPDKKPCWITSMLHLWNGVLAHDCVELCPYRWGELSLRGYEPPERKPRRKDVLRASLLIHVLLRQHRCVTLIVLDMRYVKLEKLVLWHAFKAGAAGVKWLEYTRGPLNDPPSMMVETLTGMFCEAIASMESLTYLRLSGIRFDDEVASTIGVYVEHSTVLDTLRLTNIETLQDSGRGATTFLDHLARNRSVKSLYVEEILLAVRKGQALADVVRNHVALEALEVMSSSNFNPHAVLQAAVQSQSLQSLTVHKCLIDARDVEAMASALKAHRRPATLGADMAPSRSRLEKVDFMHCSPCDKHLEEAYAKLIGVSLVSLTLVNCGLGEVFATNAASKLVLDKRMRELTVVNNNFTIDALYSMIIALKVNKTLQKLAVTMTSENSQDKASSLFDMIGSIDAFSRLKFHWIKPQASDFSKSAFATETPLVCIDLDGLPPMEAVKCLDAIASNRNLDRTLFRCAKVSKLVLRHLAYTLSRTKSLRHLMLSFSLPDTVVMKLFHALESNRSISAVDLRSADFTRTTVKALGQLVVKNRSLIYLNVVFKNSDSEDGSIVQCRNLCSELNDTVEQNRFLISISVKMGGHEWCNNFYMRNALRRNWNVVNSASWFVDGSTRKDDALAFDSLRHCASLPTRLQLYNGLSQRSAVKKVAEARERLAFEYFILAGVVRTKIACHRSGEGTRETLLDDVGRDLQARICSYLSLTDVVDS